MGDSEVLDVRFHFNGVFVFDGFSLKYCNGDEGVSHIDKDKLSKGFLDVFHRIYICLDACRRGFLDGCRRVIGLDGCFLKGPMKGELLSAIGRELLSPTLNMRRVLLSGSLDMRHVVASNS